MTTTPTITRRQRAILEFIRAYVDLHRYPPTIREIGDYVELSSPSSVLHQLRQLEDLGLITHTPGRSRAITIRIPKEPA